MTRQRSTGAIAEAPATACAEGVEVQPVHIQLLHVPDCPLVDDLRQLVDSSLASIGMKAAIDEIEGPFPSPTLVINGADVTGRAIGSEPSCRLDIPTADQIIAAVTTTSKTQPLDRRGLPPHSQARAPRRY